MNYQLIRRVALTTAGAFIISASPLHSAAVEPATAGLLEAFVQPSVWAQAQAASEARAARQAEEAAAFEVSLEAGDYVWHPERSVQGEVEIVVSIPLQRAFVYRAGTLIGVTTVSTGRQGHETPVGTFNILEKRREHYSSLYNGAPMPFMQRLTWDGIALHAGQIPGRPASHGCVRLPLEFARLLFPVTRVGASVHIVDHSPSAGEALAMVRADGVYSGMGGPDEAENGPAD
jgi:lipoprotein-anchoring transpeptidase ErfK/SrfK